MIDRTARLTVTLEAQAWDAVLNALADGHYRVVAPLIAEIQRQCMQQAPIEPDASPTPRGNGEAMEAAEAGG